MNFKKFLVILFSLIFAVTFSSCSGNSKSDYEDRGFGIYSYSKSLADSDYYEEFDKESQIQAGQLTAAAVDDNKNYDFWKSLVFQVNANSDGTIDKKKGIFFDYAKELTNGVFVTTNRIKLSFTNGLPINVNLLNESGEIENTFIPLKDGTCYIFPNSLKESYNININYYNNDGILCEYKDTINEDKNYDLTCLDKSINQIDLMFVVDATGSMGDEMSYLKAELKSVISGLEEKNTGVNIRISIMVYRDVKDDYVTRYNDFTTDLENQIDFLSKQRADGGGDFEEAVHTALTEASKKDWNENSTKILVFVADAPAHDSDIPAWNDAVKELTKKGVRIITVASSGINTKTEFLFRCQSIITGGIYTYLTNDSGIGGDHLEATTEDEVVVEFLNKMLIRLITGYHQGVFEEPVPYKQPNTQETEK